VLRLVLFLGLLAPSAAPAFDTALSPWSAPGSEFGDWTEPAPSRPREAWERLALKDTPTPDTLWLPSLLGEDLLWAYQHSFSGHTGSHCPHYPSCSRYAGIAVDRYGLTLGVMMAAERYSRCHEHANDAGQYQMKEIGGESLIWDPPMLDAWWKDVKP
jgi:putative component of membrane protein insertase Oxa1/YidC/SpoIIIJ protein YidD